MPAAPRWRQSIPGQEMLTVSVNLSPRQLTDPDLVDDVRRVLAQTGLPPSALVLELTESALADPTFDAVAVFERLRLLDVRLALDDFGTGYSSLSRLDRCPLDIVKIDKSFVDRLEAGDSNAPLLEAMLQVAGALRLGVVPRASKQRTSCAGCRRWVAPAARGIFWRDRTIPPPSSCCSLTRNWSSFGLHRTKRTFRWHQHGHPRRHRSGALQWPFFAPVTSPWVIAPAQPELLARLRARRCCCRAASRGTEGTGKDHSPR